MNDDVLNDVRKTGNLMLEKPFTLDELARALGEATVGTDAKPGQPGYTMTS